MRLRRSILTAALLTASVLALAACAATTADAPTPTADPTTSAPAATPTIEPSASATPAAAATCESILPDETVADFAEIGWSAKEEPLHVGDLRLADGLQCTWGNFDVATDHVQIFGWAPISTAEATDAQEQLIANGWRREDSADGIYITESLETAIAPADGYGITYLFGDGWVTLADTKQSLVLIEPPAV